MVVAQSLEIRVADLSAGRIAKLSPGFWDSVAKASQRTISRARQRVVIYDDLLLRPFREEEAEPRGTDPPGLWPEVVLDLWQRFRHPFNA